LRIELSWAGSFAQRYHVRELGTSHLWSRVSEEGEHSSGGRDRRIELEDSGADWNGARTHSAADQDVRGFVSL